MMTAKITSVKIRLRRRADSRNSKLIWKGECWSGGTKSGGDDAPGNLLRRALVPLSIEHDCTGEFLGPKSLQLAREQGTEDQARQAEELARVTIIRWCDWLDSAVHLRIHRLWRTAPECFVADPEKRQLAALGSAERHLPNLHPRAREAWLASFAAAVDHFKGSPKWPVVGQAMGAEPTDSWLYADLDSLVTSLWPLVTRYNWTYRDLLNVVQPALKSPEAYPCDCEQNLATYCVNALGLRKTGKERGRSASNGQPKGYEIATKWCPPLKKGKRLK